MLKTTSIILCKLLLLQTLLFQVDLPELVLCFGNDGHIAIELSEETIHNHDDKSSSIGKYFQLIDKKSEDCNDLKLDLHFSNADVKKSKNNIVRLIISPVLLSCPNEISRPINAISELSSTTNKQAISTILNTILLI